MAIQKKEASVDDCSLHCSIPAAHPPPFFPSTRFLAHIFFAHPPPFFPNTPFLAHIFFAHPATFVFTHLFWHRYFLHTLKHLFAQTSIFGTHIAYPATFFAHTSFWHRYFYTCLHIHSIFYHTTFLE